MSVVPLCLNSQHPLNCFHHILTLTITAPPILERPLLDEEKNPRKIRGKIDIHLIEQFSHPRVSAPEICPGCLRLVFLSPIAPEINPPPSGGQGGGVLVEIRIRPPPPLSCMATGSRTGNRRPDKALEFLPGTVVAVPH